MSSPQEQLIIEMLETIKLAQEKEQQILKDLIEVKDQVVNNLKLIIHKIETEL